MMTLVFNLILLAVFGAALAALWREGLWASLVMLLNVLFAGTAATMLLPVVVPLVEPRLATYTYFVDFLVLAGLFCLLLGVAREVTDRVTPTKVRFRKPVEMFGAPVAALLAAWATMAFTAAMLHTAPVQQSVIPRSGMFFGLAPDRGWLWWTVGAVGKPPFGAWGRSFEPPGAGAAGTAVGEPPAEGESPSTKDQIDLFIEHYEQRRKELGNLDGLRKPG
jgi:hypothetical protein